MNPSLSPSNEDGPARLGAQPSRFGWTPRILPKRPCNAILRAPATLRSVDACRCCTAGEPSKEPRP